MFLPQYTTINLPRQPRKTEAILCKYTPSFIVE